MGKTYTKCTSKGTEMEAQLAEAEINILLKKLKRVREERQRFSKESHQIGPSFRADQFIITEISAQEPYWIHNRWVFLESKPPAECNVLLTGDPDLRFDLLVYIWCHTNPQFAVHKPQIQGNYQHSSV